MAAFDDDIWDEELEQKNRAESIARQTQYHEREAPRSNRGHDYRSGDQKEGPGLEVFINNNDVGRVIGQRGSKIKELQRLSNASINVDTSGYDPVVRIYGSPEAQKRAKELIEETLGNFHKRVDDTKQAKDYSNEPFDWDKVRNELKKQEEERLERFKRQMPIKKNFYYENSEVAKMTPLEVQEFRTSKNNIIVSSSNPENGKQIPNPVKSFHHAFEKYPEIMRELQKAGFCSPSPIQCQAWPILLQGNDLVGIAQTGTGKTIAFLLPAFIHIESQVVPKEKRVGPTCLVLAPTRELALQILDESKKYRYKGIRSVCVYGGGSKHDQIAEVKKGVEIVIATPGRLLDLLISEVLDLICVTYLVLDEADRMLDLGFEPQIKSILRHIRPDRQTVMTSATWPVEVQTLVNEYMDEPMQINVGSMDLTAAHSVEQCFKFTDDDDERRDLLFSFIDVMEENDKLLVFVERKALVDDLASDIVLKYGMECSSIHSGREQCDREQALEDFKTGYSRVLIATDVASRGLDVKDVTHVFNMNMPRDIEDYVHRIGRTGRAGKSGMAVTIIGHKDRSKVPELIKILEGANQYVPPVLYRMAESHQRWLRDRPDYVRRGRWRK